MALEVFPESPRPTIPVEIEARFRTLISETDTGIEYRRRKWLFPRRRVRLSFQKRKEDDLNALWLFYRRHYGAYQAFWWFDYVAEAWENERVGRGDGTLTTFDLPGKEIDSSTLKVYVDGVEKALGADYTFSQGTGEGGADQIVFAAAPSAGALITADFTGRLRFKCRFAQDFTSKKRFTWVLRALELELLEVKD